MTNSPFGWGIVGTGRMAATMARALRHNPGAALLAVASRAPERAQAFAQTHAIPHPCASLAALFALENVAICYIASPPAQHRAHCLAALAAGKHVLCEKPLGLTAAEARAITEAADAAGRFCMEALWTQFIPAVTRAAALLAAGAIGRIEHLAASFGLPTDPAHAVFQPPGGGALLDRGVYPISLALRLIGAPVVGVSGTRTLNPDGVDTAATGLIRFAGGATAAIATSLTAYLGNTLTVGGSAGRLVLHEPITSPTLISLSRIDPAAVTSPPGMLKRMLRDLPGLAHLAPLRRGRLQHFPFRGEGYGAQLDEVHRCIGLGQLQSPVMDWPLSIATLAVVDSISLSGASTAGIVPPSPD